MRILVLGSSGQIGKHVTDYLRRHDVEAVEWDIQHNSSHDLRKHNTELYEVMESCDFVYYLASDVGGAKYLEKNQHQYDFIENNMLIMVNTFSLLRQTRKPFIFTSSQMAELTHSVYGQLKCIGERLTESLDGLYVRLWNVYGHETCDNKSHVITDFISMGKIDKCIKMRTDGTESRQFLYADDCAEALWILTNEYHKLDKTKKYHITSFEWYTVKEVAKIVGEIIGDVNIVPSTSLDMTQMNTMSAPDEHIKQYWIPRTTLRQGIEKMYKIS
jgi:nucleoside-diphosphate-sugar epimerase